MGDGGLGVVCRWYRAFLNHENRCFTNLFDGVGSARYKICACALAAKDEVSRKESWAPHFRSHSLRHARLPATQAQPFLSHASIIFH